VALAVAGPYANHISTLSLNFLQARCSSWCPLEALLVEFIELY